MYRKRPFVFVLALVSAGARPRWIATLGVADFERDLIIERTLAGQARARAEGTKFGRPTKTTDKQKREIVKRLSSGDTVTAVAERYRVSRGTIISIRNQAMV